MKQTIKLYNQNCLDALKEIEDESVDLILTDPPYNLGNFMRGRQTNLKKMRENFFGDAGWDDMDFDDWTKSMYLFFSQAQRVLKKKGAIIMFMSLLRVETMVEIAAKHKLYYKTTGVWHKKNPMPRNMNLHFINSTEGWLYFISKGRTGTFNNEGKALHDFIETSVAPAGEKKYGGHPTQKPEELFEHFVRILTNENDVVLDPFMGSGTAGVVSKKNNRNFIGIEIDEKYLEIAKLRMNDVDNDRYELASSGSRRLS
ncbi:site-specific DNA-methyltransferase [Bacillus subtilis]|nr:site-specific DNA-methyltransferase [Bacillus subtilis]PAE66918.1 site-specific DNA-methyltransferase [Bacillus subtilis]